MWKGSCRSAHSLVLLRGTESLFVAQIVLELTMSLADLILDPPSSFSVVLLLKSSSVVWLHYLRLHACKVNILAIELLASSIQISSLSLTQLF